MPLMMHVCMSDTVHGAVQNNVYMCICLHTCHVQSRGFLSEQTI